MMNVFWRFLKEEHGVTAIEYGLIAAGIAIVILTAVNNLGTNLRGRLRTSPQMSARERS